ncbi:MAG: alpha/beta hydrolase, partial [Terrabacter sp.]
LFGTLPFDAGVPVDAGRLAHVPVFVGQGDGDHVIPLELLTRTWDYLRDESGASTVAHRTAGGHQLTRETVDELREWLADRLAEMS